MKPVRNLKLTLGGLAVAGKYTLNASLVGTDKPPVSITLTSGTPVTTNFTFP